MRFQLIDTSKAFVSVARACRLLGVSQSGYYCGKTARRANANGMTWSCSHIFETLLLYRTRPMAPHA